MITIHDVIQGSEEWHRIRGDLYTGTDAEKLLKYIDRYKIIDGQMMRYSLKEITGFKGNFHTERGHVLEEQAVELYEKMTGEKVHRAGFVTNTNYPLCGYSPDGLPLVSVLESKSFSRDKHLELINGKVPLKVIAQMYFGLTICERPYGVLTPYNPLFAKKQIEVSGRMIDNPDYNPKLAFKIIEIRPTRAARDNFKRILSNLER